MRRVLTNGLTLWMNISPAPPPTKFGLGSKKVTLMRDHDWTSLGAVIVGLSAMGALALYVHIIGLVLERG